MCQRLLNNYASDSWTSKCSWGNVYAERPSSVNLYHIKSSPLITIRDKLTGFTKVWLLLKCIYKQTGVCLEMSFGRDLCPTKTGQLICKVHKLTGFYILRVFIEKDFWKDIVVFCEYLSVKRAPIIRKQVNWFVIQLVPVIAERHFCTSDITFLYRFFFL